jgi:nanoRNase/pAp phosphatase (c-di-AMP/oligoRNAs hydrolase)
MKKMGKATTEGHRTPRGKQPYSRLLQAVFKADSLLIVPHNDPDPDAIAAAIGIQHLLFAKIARESTIAYQGIVGRAENKALVEYLGHPLRHLQPQDFLDNVSILLIDSQPGSGNNPLPPTKPATVVIDHHLSRNPPLADYIDIRSDYGATSTIITEYLRAAKVDIEAPLATALFYGIKTDTRGLARHASKADVRAYFYLQQRVDVEALAKIERAQVPVGYFRSLDRALHSAHIYDGLVTAFLQRMDYPDQAAEIADLLLRLQDSEWIVCCGVYDDTLMISVRSRNEHLTAQTVVQALVAGDGSAGGHGALAGGQIPLAGRDSAIQFEIILHRAQQVLGIPTNHAGQPII